MRRLAITAVVLALVLVAAGCGGGSGTSAKTGQTHTTRSVTKAFYDAGIPFTTDQAFDPSVSGQAVFLPGKLNTSSLRNAVETGLSETTNFTGVVAWVFDTDAHAAEALKVVPLAHWLPESPPVVRLHDGNVVIVAFGFKGDAKKKLDAALAAVKTTS